MELSDGDLFDLTYLDLCKLIQDTKLNKEQIAKENVLLEKYMLTLSKDKEKAERVADKPKADSKIFKPIKALSEASGASSEFSSSVSTFIEKGAFLPIEQKCEIAAYEIESVKEKIQTLHQDLYENITPLKVKFEELTVRAHDFLLDKTDFSRDVISDGINVSTGKVMLEKVLLYFKRSIRSKEIQLERCRLEHNTLIDMEKKIENQLKQKEELGDTLREVDYDQLKIENAQFSEKVDDRNDALLRIKYLMSLTLQYLGQQKMKLKQLTAQDKEMQAQLKTQRDNIENLEVEIKQAKQEVLKMNRQIRHLKHQLENYRVPDVMDYITTQAEIYDLNKIVNIWQRRVSITRRSLDAKSKLWDRLKKKHKLDDTVVKIDAEVNTIQFSDDDEDFLSESASDYTEE